MTVKKTMGRPKKISTEDKVAIVTRYYLTHEESLRDHGIYSRLSNYAKSLCYSLEARDFSRDPAVREQINKLVSQTRQKHPLQEASKSELPIPSYIPLDIPTLMNRSRNTIADTLAGREQYFQNLHIKAAHAIEDYNTLFKQNHLLQEEVTRLRGEHDLIESEKKALKLELHDAKVKISYLTRIIKKDVESEKAHQFLQSLTTQEKIVETVKKTVYHTVDALCNDDRQMHKDALEEIDKTDLSNLFK